MNLRIFPALVLAAAGIAWLAACSKDSAVAPDTGTDSTTTLPPPPPPSSAPAKRLEFRMPADTFGVNDTLPAVHVLALDSAGLLAVTAHDSVSITLDSAAGMLAGAHRVLLDSGIATFTGLRLTGAGEFNLVATAPGLVPDTSAALVVRADSDTTTGGGGGGNPPAAIGAAIAAGGSTTCGLASDGTPWCWGSDVHGELGDGRVTQSSVPVEVADHHTFVSLASGIYTDGQRSFIGPLGRYACGSTSAGEVWCWGHGYGPTPLKLGGSVNIKKVVAGPMIQLEDFVCGLSADSTGYCWVKGAPQNLGYPKLIDLVSGATHTCGLAADGSAYCSSGEGAYPNLPVQKVDPVPGGHHFTAISAFAYQRFGYGNVCGLEGGTAWCWGWGVSPSLPTTPAAVAGHQFVQLARDCGLTASGEAWCGLPNAQRVGGSLTFRSITRAYENTCGIDTNGIAYCWGTNENGQLGNGQIDTTTEPGGDHAPAMSDTPVRVLGGQSFSAVEAGIAKTCGLATDGRAWCWGTNDGGDLGDGSSRIQNRPVLVAGSHHFSGISAGDQSCGLESNGSAWCWGMGESRPVLVPGGLHFRTVVTNGEVCGVASDSLAYCWSKPGDTPTVVSSYHFVSFTAGYRCGLLADGSARCWSQGTTGAPAGGTHPPFTRLTAGGAACGLGTDSVAVCWSTYSPDVASRLSLSEKLVTIAGGGSKTCGLTTSGTAWCWEYDNNARAIINVAQAPGSNHYVEISTHGEVTCGITSSGAAYCWGFNNSGQLGNGTTTDSQTPVLVTGGIAFRH